MLEKELSFADLPISLSEIYETMGYADAVPDEAVEKEVRGVLGRVEAVTSPRFCFFISGGDLDETKDLLTVGKGLYSGCHRKYHSRENCGLYGNCIG